MDFRGWGRVMNRSSGNPTYRRMILPIVPVFFLLAAGLSLAAPVDQKSCDSLFQKYIQLAQGDPDFGLQSSFGLVKNGLQSGESRNRFRSWCSERVDTDSYQCMMGARSMKGLLSCPLAEKTDPPNTPANGGSSMENQGTGGESGSAGNQEGTAGGSTVATSGNVTVMKVNDSGGDVDDLRCRKAYDHMLRVYENPPSGDDRYKTQDFLKMVASWKTSEARASFEKRCRESFKIGDLNCITGSTDPDIIQACLVQIP